jgi:phage-related protein (TIGR01555 family)
MKKWHAMKRLDAWKSSESGMGGSSDPIHRTSFSANGRLTTEACEMLFRKNWIANRIVAKVPEIALSKGYTFSGFKKDELKEISNRMYDLRIDDIVMRALITARLSGIAYIFIGALDGNNVEEELNEKLIAQIPFFEVYDRDECQPATFRTTTIDSGAYGRPEYYYVTPASGKSMRIVHRSRIIEVAGTFSTNRTLVKNNYQPDSVLDAAYEALQRFGITMQTASYIIQDFVTKVMKIKDFDQQFGDEETASDLQSRVEFMQTSNAAWSTVMIDSEEEFQKIYQLL